MYHHLLKYFIQTMPHGCTFIILHIFPSVPFYTTSDIQLLLYIGRYLNQYKPDPDNKSSLTLEYHHEKQNKTAIACPSLKEINSSGCLWGWRIIVYPLIHLEFFNVYILLLPFKVHIFFKIS